VIELVDEMINALYAEEYRSPDFNQMMQTTIRLLDEYEIRFSSWCRIFVDGAKKLLVKY
jgi:hypothetical protein